MIAKTNCAGCVFAEKQNEKQNGCSLGRAEKLGITNEEENSYILERFCAAYRPEEWLKNLSVSESMDIKESVLHELKPRVGFFLLFDKSMKDLERALDEIKNQSISARYIIIINMDVEYNQEIYNALTSRFDFDKTEFHIVQPLEKPDNESRLIDESFRHAKNGWAYFCRCSEKIDHQLIEKIHIRVNLQMKKLVVVKPYDDKHNGLLFQTSLFKFLNGNGVKVFQDASTDNRLFLDKIKEAAENSDKETFITWSEFNES